MSFISELERLKEKATKGPWIAQAENDPQWAVRSKENKFEFICITTQGNDENNARLISFLRNHADEIAELVKAAETEVAPFFRSGNCIPVERAVIRKEQILGFLNALAALNKEKS